MTDTLASQGEGAALAPVPLDGAFLTEKSKLFWLAFWTGLLTVLTLGIYRFWARTRLRRYIWSAIDAGGDSFEYTGMGLEKFLGFLIALVVLAVYLGLLQVVLSFVGFNLWGAISSEPNGPTDMLMQMAATYAAGLAVLPLIFFAQYRARRYMLSRTRLPEPEQNHRSRPNLGTNSGMVWGQYHGCCAHGFCNCTGLGWAIGRFYPTGAGSQSWQCRLATNRAPFVRQRRWRLALHQPQGANGLEQMAQALQQGQEFPYAIQVGVVDHKMINCLCPPRWTYHRDARFDRNGRDTRTIGCGYGP